MEYIKLLLISSISLFLLLLSIDSTGDPSTPDILQSADKKTLSLNSQIGYAYETIKEMIDVIGSLTSRLEVLESK